MSNKPVTRVTEMRRRRRAAGMIEFRMWVHADELALLNSMRDLVEAQRAANANKPESKGADPGTGAAAVASTVGDVGGRR